MGDPINDFLEQQRAQDEADLFRRLRRESAERLRQLKAKVPDGRYDFPQPAPPAVPGELWPGEDLKPEWGWGLV